MKCHREKEYECMNFAKRMIRRRSGSWSDKSIVSLLSQNSSTRDLEDGSIRVGICSRNFWGLLPTRYKCLTVFLGVLRPSKPLAQIMLIRLLQWRQPKPMLAKSLTWHAHRRLHS